MKPFSIPPWRKKQIDKKYRAKNKVITRAVDQMEAVMKKAVDSIMEHYFYTQHYAEPSLNEMFNISENFYRNVISESFKTAKEEEKLQRGKKRLAKGGPPLPRSLKDLEKVFRNSKEWAKITKRSNKLTERLRKQYLEKLRKKFQKIVPQLTSGELSPQEAKNALMDSWKASKPRVETIFRTETTNYFAKAQVSFFQGDPGIIGFMFDSLKDRASTDTCMVRHGLIFRPNTKELTENTPALHYNCRSHLITLANTEMNRKLLEDTARDPSTAANQARLSKWKPWVPPFKKG